MTKLFFLIVCVSVVQWSRSCLHTCSTPATLFSVSLYVFFFSVWPFFNTTFPFGLFFSLFLLLTLLLIHSDQYPEFYFGKGISKAGKALDLHTGQAYDQKKNISCQDMSLLWNSWIFLSMLVDIMTNNTQYTTTALIYTQHPLVTHWRKLNLPFVHLLNHQYYYPRMSTGFAPQK